MAPTQVGWKTPDIAQADPGQLARVGTILRGALARGPVASPALAVFSGDPVRPAALAGLLAPRDLASLERWAVLEYDGHHLLCPFRAHLVAGFLVFTDPEVPSDEQASTYLDPLWEAPYLAKVLVRGCVHRALDVGCGCGVLSLILASCAQSVLGVDINPRALTLSCFNARLNGVTNTDFLPGDLFEPVRAQKYDRIVFNSPTDCEGEQFLSLLYAGEGILERFFTEMPAVLTAAGHCQVNLAMNDRPGSPFLKRLRAWLGTAAREFQVLLLTVSQIRRGPNVSWRRGWLTMRRGPAITTEVPFRYDNLPAGWTGEEGSLLIHRLLNAAAQGGSATDPGDS